jgi:hypothetical protein
MTIRCSVMNRLEPGAAGFAEPGILVARRTARGTEPAERVPPAAPLARPAARAPPAYVSRSFISEIARARKPRRNRGEVRFAHLAHRLVELEFLE